MMLKVHALVAGGLVVLLAGAGVPALAQDTGVQRPYRGLFGNASDRTARHKLDSTVSLTAAYDSELPPDLGNTGLPQPESIGHSTMLTNGLQYGWTGRPLQIEASGAGGVRYYPSVDDIRIVNGAALVAVTAPLPARSAVAFSQTAAYTPAYLYNLFPQVGGAAFGEGPPPPSPDYAVNGSASYGYSSAMTLAFNPLGVNSLVGSADLQRTKIKGGPAGAPQDLTVAAVQGQYARRLRRRLTATALYRYRSSNIVQGLDSPNLGKFIEHGLEVGIQYRRPLSATRQFSFDGRIGSAALLLPASFRDRALIREPYRLLGDFTVGYQFKRTWQASGSYRGSYEYVPGLREPVSTDGGTASVDGFLARRINLFTSAAYSSGESTWTPNSVRFSTYTGNVRLRFPLTTVFALYTEYLYYFYDFGGSEQLAPGIPHQLERSGVRLGFTVLVPVLRSR